MLELFYITETRGAALNKKATDRPLDDSRGFVQASMLLAACCTLLWGSIHK